MRMISPRDFTGTRAWDALMIEAITGTTTVRLHWTDEPYKWHVNDGPEVFVVLDGEVEMHTKEGDKVVISYAYAKKIPVLDNYDWLETDPLGRAEWIKFFAALTGTEQQATEVRGIFAHPDDHAEVKEAAAKIARRRARAAKRAAP